MPTAETLPFRLAIRAVMEDVWYSNALPEWYTPQRINEAQRVKSLVDRANKYLAGESPLPALPVRLPRVTRGVRNWVVPAVNDQIILQACVANIAPVVAKSFDHRRVYSFAPNDNPSRVAFMKPQIVALSEFYKETIRRIPKDGFVLELDIEKAFASVDRASFFAFLQELKPNGVEVDLIRRLLVAWSGKEPGIPLVNDSVFFLGSAYLGVVDRTISTITDDFIRYMDDYRVFGASQMELERVFERISQGVEQLGLKINPQKVRIASKKDFSQPLTKPEFAKQTARHDYVTELDIRIDQQIAPHQVTELVARSLANPNEYLNEGIGRYLLGAMRRYRLNYAIHRRAGEVGISLGDSLRRRLRLDSKAVKLTGTRLSEYGKDPENSWRAIWVLYLIEQQGTAKLFEPRLTQIEQSAQMPQEVKLWARRCRLRIGGEPERLHDESLHDLSYIDAGRRCYGESVCKGEGF